MAVKRLNYFTGEFLKEADFTDEQQYHLKMRRLHNQHLHSAGIAYGLKVTAGTGAVIVDPGMAVDPQGQEVIVETQQNVAVSNAPALIVISYSEKQTDETSETGVKGNTRWEEDAVLASISEAAKDPNKHVVLARVSAGGGNGPVTLDAAFVPQYSAPAVSGDLIVSHNLTVNHDVTVQGNLKVQGQTTVISTEQMQGNVILGDQDTDTVTVKGRMLTGNSSGKLEIASAVEVTGTATMGADLTAAGKIGIGTTSPNQKLAVTGAESTAHGFNAAIGLVNTAAGGAKWYLRSGATGTATPAGGFSIADENTYKLVINSAGNVGIGTTDPQEVLHVKGNIAANGNLNVSGAIIQEDWAAPVLAAGWVNYGSGYSPAGYFIDKNGIVHLRGLVKKNANENIVFPGQLLFTLPAGYRPDSREIHIVATSISGAVLGGAPNTAFGRCDIDDQGQVLVIQGNTQWFSLDGITFRAGIAQFRVILNNALNVGVMRFL